MNWAFLAQMGLLVTLFAYVFLLGGGFPALVDVRLQTISTGLDTAILGGWLLWRLAHRQRIALSGIEIGMGAFLTAQVVAVAFSEDPRRSLPVALSWLAYFIIFYFLLDLLRSHWKSEYVEQAALIAGGMVLLFGLGELVSQYAGWKQLAGLEYIPSFKYRVQSVLGDPNLLAAFTNLLLPLALAKTLTAKWPAKLLPAAFFLLGLVMVYFTDSRGGLLGLGASLGLFSLLWITVGSENAKDLGLRAWHFLWERKLVLLALLAVVALAAGIFVWQTLTFQGDTTHAPALTARDIYWEAARIALANDPLTGAGPGMYPVYLMQIWSTPPARPYLHAHSFPFQIAAESGWLGLAGLATLLGLFLWQAWQALGHLGEAGKQRWVIGVAALAGLAAHSVVDDFFPFPAAAVPAMLWMAFVLQGRRPQKGTSGFSPAWLLAGALVVGAMSVYSLGAYWQAEKATVAGDDGDWGLAANLMGSAAEADPGEAFYWLQSGYALARNGEYQQAITNYQQGVALEPIYGLNHANLGQVYWQAGKLTEALDQVRIATSLSPEAWQFWLERGALEEALGDEAAASSYNEALVKQPQIAASVFWGQSELRREVVAGFALPAAEDTAKVQARELALEAKNAISKGDLKTGQTRLQEAWRLNDQEPSVYIGLAQLFRQDGDLDTALKYVQAALWVPATSNQPKVEAVLVGAETTLAKGDAELALQLYQSAFENVMQNSSYGWGGADWNPYSWFVFQRSAFPEDMLPFFMRADITQDIAQRLEVLVDLYEEAGMQQQAEEVRLTLEPYLP